MELECAKEKIEAGLNIASRAVGRNLNLPVLSCVLLEAEKNILKIKATNLDLGIEVHLPVKVSQKGVVAVPASVLLSFVSSLSGGVNLKFKVEGGSLAVIGPQNKTLIKSVSTDDFPTIPTLQSINSVRVPAKEFSNGIKSVCYSAALSAMKPELSSVFIYPSEDGLVFAATDSFRLAEKKIKTKQTTAFKPVLIPAKNAAEIGRILEEMDGEVEVEAQSGQLAIATDSLYLVTRVIEGSFPDYKQIIPKDKKTNAVVLKEDLVKILKTASVFSDKFNHLTFKIKPKEKQLIVETKNNEVGESTALLEAALEGEAFEVSFNYRYLTECLGVIKSDSLDLAWSGSGKPLLVRGVGDNTFLYLVMPMNR